MTDQLSPDEYDDNASDAESLINGEDGVKLESSRASPDGSNSTGRPQPVKPPTHLQKRRRVTRACDECRRKKIKCDGKQPCTHCTVYSYECTYDQPSNRRRNPAPQYVENLEHRVHRAETLLHILIPNLDLNHPRIEAAVSQGWIPGAPGKGDPTAASAAAAAAAAAALDNPRPLERPQPAPRDQTTSDTNLESMVRAVASIEMDERGYWDYHGHSSGLAFVRRMGDRLGDLMGPTVATTPFVKTRPYSQILDSPRSLNDSPAESSPAGLDLPPREIARILCSHTLDDAAALLRFIHKPSFWQSFDRLYSVPTEQYSNEDNGFLPLLYSSMALGSLFAGKEEEHLDRDGYENAIQHGFVYFKQARQMMDIADVRDLTSLQAVMCMILFLQSSAKLSQCYAYIGVALRSALRMGLHRAYAGQFDPLEAETRKRMFWVVRKMDIYVGAMLGLPQMLGDDDVDQEYPLEVDDEYITKDGILPMPENSVSLMTAFNAHTRLVVLLSKIVRNVYPIKVQQRQGHDEKSYTVPFSLVREIESNLEAWKKSLPPALDPAHASERYVRIQQLLRLSYAHAQVMLYRPFLHFISADKRAPGAKTVDQRAYACAATYINVSRNIVHITTHMNDRGLLNGPHWFVMYTAFFSILSLVYFAAENPDNSTTQAVMHDAIEGRNVLKQLAKRSLAADRCSSTLDVVFNRIPDWMRDGKQNPVVSKKRGFNKLPEEASAHTGSPKESRGYADVPNANRSHLGEGLVHRASTFPNRGTPTRSVEQQSVDSPWTQSGSSYGPHTPNTGNGFDASAMGVFPQPNGTTPATSNMQNSAFLQNMNIAALPDLSAMVFPPSDEPFGYPSQPLTTFENNHHFAKDNPYLMTPGFAPMDNGIPASTRTGHEEGMEAQFYPLPPFMEQDQSHHGLKQLHHEQNMSMSANPMGFGPGLRAGAMDPATIAGNWQHQQSIQPDVSNINLQDLFGGTEYNPLFLGGAFRQQQR